MDKYGEELSQRVAREVSLQVVQYPRREAKGSEEDRGKDCLANSTQQLARSILN